MRNYESMFILAPTLAPEAIERLVSSFEDVITNGGGTVNNTNSWGRRKFAYEIQKFNEGIYTIFDFDGPNDLVKELERRYRLNDSVLKFLTVKTERKRKLEAKGSAKRKAKQESKARRKERRGGGDERGER